MLRHEKWIIVCLSFLELKSFACVTCAKHEGCNATPFAILSNSLLLPSRGIVRACLEGLAGLCGHAASRRRGGRPPAQVCTRRSRGGAVVQTWTQEFRAKAGQGRAGGEAGG